MIPTVRQQSAAAKTKSLLLPQVAPAAPENESRAGARVSEGDPAPREGRATLAPSGEPVENRGGGQGKKPAAGGAGPPLPLGKLWKTPQVQNFAGARTPPNETGKLPAGRCSTKARKSDD